ncbi:zinc finger protein 184-like [Vespa velutina]|uniref:zinc finger protein 184-like n=1 Tax=Vespa velutina TaxID=202808 RepID=UPI001FB449A3|nr:zinc finger protein 184-like [Vespa velutina]XP_047367328.1 zinc finger protein 184-like [Vespa velutina]
MEAHENEQYVTFPLSGVHDNIQENIISHEEICEPVDDCVLQDGLNEVPVNDVNTDIQEAHVAVEILPDRSDEEDENRSVYPIYIKQEEQQQYTSGDDESMAVEALRQLGGMYPCFENKKVSCPNCANLFTQIEFTKHQGTCNISKLSCPTCGETFERKMDLNNHMVCHQVDRPHACRTCGNLFRSKSSLQSHMLQVHQIERPHKCTICGADFQRPSSLSNHMKIHTYVAGRAIMQSRGNNQLSQSVDTFRKWSENNTSESQNVPVPSSTVQTVQNYNACQVHWAVPAYTFQNEQSSTVNTISNHDEKIDTLHEFNVLPNGEVTQFEYTQQNNMNNQINQQYSLSLNTFNNSDSMVKVEALTYNNDSRRNYVDMGTDVNKQHTCSHCGISFSRAIALVSHEKIHTSKNWMPIECEYCDKQFQDANHLATHQTTCTKKIMQNNIDQGVSNSKWGKHACSECGKKFTTKQKMFRHQWIHRKKTHCCEVCGTQFEKQNQLDKHRLSAHPGDSPFTCTECGKSFVSRQGLWEHGRTHAGSPAHFHCDTCSKTFSSRQGYLIHHRTHTGERPYGCKFCWKAFRDGGTLRKHERIHTGERPHVCPLCSRAFNQKVVLREHVRWVHAAGKNETEVTGPPYPCPLCGALNQDRDELCAHIVKHSDQMIAEAKAKTNNNAPKSRPTRKKTKASIVEGTQEKPNLDNNEISRLEQNKALLSITEAMDKTECQQIVNDKQNNTYLVVTAERHNENLIAISELKHNNVRLILDDKQNENVNITQNDHDRADSYLITMNKQNDTTHILPDNNALRAITTTRNDEVDTMHLIQSSKQSNTLHLLSKPNESLPVLTISNNPEDHENYSSQIAQIGSTDLPMDMATHDTSREDQAIKSHNGNRQESLLHEGVSQGTVIQIVHYQQDSDDGEELVCGICGEDFTDKNILMEHVKIHI